LSSNLETVVLPDDLATEPVRGYRVAPDLFRLVTIPRAHPTFGFRDLVRTRRAVHEVVADEVVEASPFSTVSILTNEPLTPDDWSTLDSLDTPISVREERLISVAVDRSRHPSHVAFLQRFAEQRGWELCLSLIR
jgi:hypothetical protein